jgi:uncharacterized protein YjbI with pentapeptide repeats
MKELQVKELVDRLARHQSWLKGDKQHGAQLCLGEVIIRDVDFSGVDLRGGQWWWCHFVGCQFHVCRMGKSDMVNCVFESCDFDHADLTESRVDKCSFNGCGLAFSAWEGCQVTKSKFMRADGWRSYWRRANIKDCSFYTAQMAHSDWRESIVQRCSFAFASIAFSDWRQSRQVQIKWSGCRMEGIRTVDVHL